MFGSDYGGDHKSSRFNAYCFLIADETPSRWAVERRRVRQKYLSDGRRMSFKRLGDPQRQQALVPFLEAADTLNGHLIGVLVDKKLKPLSTGKNTLQLWTTLVGLSGKWNIHAFESMARKAHFFALCVAQWSRPRSDITWITDEDEFVANDARLDDAQKFAARLMSLYTDHPLGVFAMNSTAIDTHDRGFEDFVAIPDLAAGMLSEVCSKLSKTKNWHGLDDPYILEEKISYKAEFILNWFSFAASRLRRTCIVIDKVGDRGRVMKLNSASFGAK
ncbi:MAG TPA: hypothetical protein VF007_05515 [Stellaceae bacterium]